MNRYHEDLADFHPSVLITGKVEEAIFWYLLVLEAILHLC